jgi:hypothetical protein
MSVRYTIGHGASMAALRAGAPGPIEAGGLTVSVTVSARYGIGHADR